MFEQLKYSGRSSTMQLARHLHTSISYKGGVAQVTVIHHSQTSMLFMFT